MINKLQSSAAFFFVRYFLIRDSPLTSPLTYIFVICRKKDNLLPITIFLIILQCYKTKFSTHYLPMEIT